MHYSTVQDKAVHDIAQHTSDTARYRTIPDNTIKKSNTKLPNRTINANTMHCSTTQHNTQYNRKGWRAPANASHLSDSAGGNIGQKLNNCSWTKSSISWENQNTVGSWVLYYGLRICSTISVYCNSYHSRKSKSQHTIADIQCLHFQDPIIQKSFPCSKQI